MRRVCLINEEQAVGLISPVFFLFLLQGHKDTLMIMFSDRLHARADLVTRTLCVMLEARTGS